MSIVPVPLDGAADLLGRSPIVTVNNNQLRPSWAVPDTGAPPRKKHLDILYLASRLDRLRYYAARVGETFCSKKSVLKIGTRKESQSPPSRGACQLLLLANSLGSKPFQPVAFPQVQLGRAWCSTI